MANNKRYLGLALTALTIAACTNSQTSFTPKCDFTAYNEHMIHNKELTLVPQAEGSMVNIPLNSILVNKQKSEETILPIAVHGQRLVSQNLKVSARVQNCSDKPVSLLARATFYNDAQFETETPTAWTRIFVPANSRGNFQTSSLTKDAASFLIEFEMVE